MVFHFACASERFGGMLNIIDEKMLRSTFISVICSC